MIQYVVMCGNIKNFSCRFSLLEKMSGRGKVLFLVRSSKLKIYFELITRTAITIQSNLVMHSSLKELIGMRST